VKKDAKREKREIPFVIAVGTFNLGNSRIPMFELISIDFVCILFARSCKNAGQEAAITKPWQTRPAFVTHNSDFHVPNTIAATELSLLQNKTKILYKKTGEQKQINKFTIRCNDGKKYATTES
jgi:hypothetical protein